MVLCVKWVLYFSGCGIGPGDDNVVRREMEATRSYDLKRGRSGDVLLRYLRGEVLLRIGRRY